MAGRIGTRSLFRRCGCILALLACVVPLPLHAILVCDFEGTSPATNTPWTATSELADGVAFGGWTLGSGTVPSGSIDDAFGFSVSGPGDGGGVSTLASALDGGRFIAFTLTPSPGEPLDLSLLQVSFTIERHSWHAARRYALFSTVDGFSSPADALFTTAEVESGDFAPRDHSFFLPPEGFDAIDGTIEFRLYAFAANWSGHETALNAFAIRPAEGGVVTLTLSAGDGGSISSDPDGFFHASGAQVRIHAQPDEGMRFAGWGGDVTGRGNPLTMTLDNDTTVEALFEPWPTAPMRVGTNLSGIADWETDWPFLDMFRKTRDWETRNADGTGGWGSGYRDAIPRDAFGFPTHIPFDPGTESPPQIVHTLVANLYQAGEWTFSWEGTGQMRLSAGGWVTLDAEGGEGSHTFMLGQPGATIFFEILESDAADPLRNFRLLPSTLPPGSGEHPFHPLYAERLEPFGLMRYMDWAHTNGSPWTSWSHRTTPQHNTQARAEGVAPEFMAELSNVLEAEPWVCVPHGADDDLVRELAALLRDEVALGLRVWVEYSNETWNFHPAFPQTQYVQERGLAEGLSADSWEAGHRYVAVRSIRIWEIFEEEFGDASDRIVRVLGTQVGWDDVGRRRIAAFNNPELNPDRVMPDALALAPYFGGNFSPNDIAENGYPDAGQIVTVRAPAAIENARQITRTHRAMAAEQGMALVCYEGGQHFVGVAGAEGDDTLTDILIEANRHPLMYDRYTEYLEMLQEEGVELFANFSYVYAPNRWGSWGVLEHQDQPVEEAHKYRALVDFVQRQQASGTAWLVHE